MVNMTTPTNNTSTPTVTNFLMKGLDEDFPIVDSYPFEDSENQKCRDDSSVSISPNPFKPISLDIPAPPPLYGDLEKNILPPPSALPVQANYNTIESHSTSKIASPNLHSFKKFPIETSSRKTKVTPHDLFNKLPQSVFVLLSERIQNDLEEIVKDVKQHCLGKFYSCLKKYQRFIFSSFENFTDKPSKEITPLVYDTENLFIKLFIYLVPPKIIVNSNKFKLVDFFSLLIQETNTNTINKIRSSLKNFFKNYPHLNLDDKDKWLDFSSLVLFGMRFQDITSRLTKTENKVVTLKTGDLAADPIEPSSQGIIENYPRIESVNTISKKIFSDETNNSFENADTLYRANIGQQKAISFSFRNSSDQNQIV